MDLCVRGLSAASGLHNVGKAKSARTDTCAGIGGTSGSSSLADRDSAMPSDRTGARSGYARASAPVRSVALLGPDLEVLTVNRCIDWC